MKDWVMRQKNGLLMTAILYHVPSVGVPMFWPDWQDQKMRQHQNRFGALGSSPPRPEEGSLRRTKNDISLKLKRDVRLGMKRKGGLK